MLQVKMESQLLDIVNNYLKVNPVEESFVTINVYQKGLNEKNADKLTSDILSAFATAPLDNRESMLRQLLQVIATTDNYFKLLVLMNALLLLTDNHIISAKLLCDKILLCDKLTHENRHFWVESFKVVKKIIHHVDYKGVREIMRICRDKAQVFPSGANITYMPQLLALEDVIRFIFDRNNCLLPAYFIANEIMKPVAYHWKLNMLMIDFVEEFRKIAQMVSIIGQSSMLPIVEQFGYADHMMNSWKLDYNTLKFTFKGSLPYEPEFMVEQTKLLRYVLQQSYSREMISVMLNVQKQQKQRCCALEEQLVDLIIHAMENTDANEHSTGSSFNGFDDKLTQNEWIWLHLSSHLIYFVLFQFVSFMHVVLALYEKLAKKDLRKGRDHLMWILLQFISGSIQKNPIANFLPMFKLFDLLYPETEPLKLPDFTKSSSLRQMAPVCTWIHLMKKAVADKMNINRPLPIALKNHYDFLQLIVKPNSMMSMSVGSDFRVILICNAYSTNQDYFPRPLNTLVDSLSGNAQSATGAPLSPVPFSIVVLDSLTVHSKMSLIHSFITQMIKHAPSKTAVPSPALVETYARLLVYTEIESLGIKGFLANLLPTVFKHQNWRILHTLLEMFSYRLHHVPTHYRMQLLSHLHSLSSLPQNNKMQLNLCFESTALKIITGFGSAEIQPQLSRHFNEKLQGSIASTDSEELNRVLILTLARAMYITGSGDELQVWCKELLSTIIQNTPHSWASYSLSCFPPALAEFFSQNTHPVENKPLLKKAVEEEYRTWTSMTNENDILVHFIRPNPNHLFLCLLFKMIWETENITPVAYKILEGINPRAFSAHLRKLCDYLVGEVVASNGKDFIHKCVDTISNMMWKYSIVSIDRVVLCLALRSQEGNEAQVCFLIIQLLLLKSPDVRSRIQDFSIFNPDHWKQTNWHEKHISFHAKFPEKFASDESASQPPLPVYFSNVCLRLLPVMDIVIHRYIELTIPHVYQVLEVILEHLCPIYKFHDRPITYLYNTLSFYERILRDRPTLKRKLVSSITGAFNEIRPANWALSDQYMKYLTAKDTMWNPDLQYYAILLKRLIDTIDGKAFFNTDWRFNEFPNAPAHALYVTCVELLSLPLSPSIVANNIIDVVEKGFQSLRRKTEIEKYLNAVGIILAALPETYWSAIYDRIATCLKSPQMLTWKFHLNIFDMCNFKRVSETMCYKHFVVTLALAHSTFHHMNGFKLASMCRYLEEKLKPCVHNENQLVFICHVFGPFLQRILQEKPNAVAGIAVLLYEMLEVVDKYHGPAPLKHMDSICDFLYHIKYIHVGNIIKNETEPIIKRLRPALQVRLRFMTHLNLEDIHADKHMDTSNVNPHQSHHNQQEMSQQQISQQMTAIANVSPAQQQSSIQHQQNQQPIQPLQNQVQATAAQQQLQHLQQQQQIQQQQQQHQQVHQQQAANLPNQSIQMQQAQAGNLMGAGPMGQQASLQHQQALQHQQMQLNPQQQHQLQQIQHQQQQFQLQQQLQMQQQQQNIRHN